MPVPATVRVRPVSWSVGAKPRHICDPQQHPVPHLPRIPRKSPRHLTPKQPAHLGDREHLDLPPIRPRPRQRSARLRLARVHRTPPISVSTAGRPTSTLLPPPPFQGLLHLCPPSVKDLAHHPRGQRPHARIVPPAAPSVIPPASATPADPAATAHLPAPLESSLRSLRPLSRAGVSASGRGGPRVRGQA